MKREKKGSMLEARLGSGAGFFCEQTPLSVPICSDVTSHRHKKWVSATGKGEKSEEVILLPSAEGDLETVLWRPKEVFDFWDAARLAQALPAGAYHLHHEDAYNPQELALLCVGWGLAAYRFDRYVHVLASPAAQIQKTLVWPKGVDRNWVMACIEATMFARDLINTPANDLTPEALRKEAEKLAAHHRTTCDHVSGAALKAAYPSVHMVGKASENAPELIDLTWQHDAYKKTIVLVGKGVCFDSGGLDIKPSSGMLLMKKDMGGAAQILALAHMIMALKLPVKLRVLIPAVENSISGSAMRPSDILHTRKGTTVEIGNTDAEGRLILCDALFEAAQDKPDLIIDCATLTGAARVALGADLPAIFCNDDAIWTLLNQSAKAFQDPLWRLPLHQPYAKTLKSSVADLNNVGKSSYGGAITAALFLEHFVTPVCPWVHVDMMAYNLGSSPGRPEGGDAMGLRALWGLIDTLSVD